MKVDVAILGTGPSGLCTLSRMLLPDTDTMGDEEHSVQCRHGTRIGNTVPSSVALVDPNSDCQWCSELRRAFQALNIDFMRSTFSGHPDPRDEVALFNFAHSRTDEPHPMEPSVDPGRVVRQNVERQMFSIPAADTMWRFVDTIGRECLDAAKRAGTSIERVPAVAQTIQWDDAARHFVIGFNQGLPVLTARIVVYACGRPAAACRIPRPLAHLTDSPLLSHARCIHEASPGELQMASKERATVVVVGGGLTACDLAVTLARKNPLCTVHIVSRRPIRVSPFDLPLTYFGSQARNERLFRFFELESPNEREQFLLSERPSASVTSKTNAAVARLQQDGRVVLHQAAEVVTCSESASGKQLDLELSDGETLASVARVWMATGSAADVRACPLLSSLSRQVPIRLSESGLPWLDESRIGAQRIVESEPWSRAMACCADGSGRGGGGSRGNAAEMRRMRRKKKKKEVRTNSKSTAAAASNRFALLEDCTDA